MVEYLSVPKQLTDFNEHFLSQTKNISTIIVGKLVNLGLLLGYQLLFAGNDAQKKRTPETGTIPNRISQTTSRVPQITENNNPGCGVLSGTHAEPKLSKRTRGNKIHCSVSHMSVCIYIYICLYVCVYILYIYIYTRTLHLSKVNNKKKISLPTIIIQKY